MQNKHRFLAILMAVVMLAQLIPFSPKAEASSENLSANSQKFKVQDFEIPAPKALDLRKYTPDEQGIVKRLFGMMPRDRNNLKVPLSVDSSTVERGYLEHVSFRTREGKIAFCLDLGRKEPTDNVSYYDHINAKYDQMNWITRTVGDQTATIARTLAMFKGEPITPGTMRNGLDIYVESFEALEYAASIAIKISQGDAFQGSNYLPVGGYTRQMLHDGTFKPSYKMVAGAEGMAQRVLKPEDLELLNNFCDSILKQAEAFLEVPIDRSFSDRNPYLEGPTKEHQQAKDGVATFGPFVIRTEDPQKPATKYSIQFSYNPKNATTKDFKQEFYDASGKRIWFVYPDQEFFLKIFFKSPGTITDMKIGISSEPTKSNVIFYPSPSSTETNFIRPVATTAEDETVYNDYQRMFIVGDAAKSGFGGVFSATADVPVFRIIKKDAEGRRLEGVVFSINGKEYTTDANGEINATDVAFGEYTVKEVRTLEGYALDETPKTGTYDMAHPVDLTFVNVKEEIPERPVTLKKTDAVSGKPVAGATIEVKDAQGNHIKGSPFVTPENGDISFTVLPGTYTFKETIAPNGYILSEETATFTVEKDGKVTGKTTLTNQPIPAKPERDVTITKTDMVSGAPVEGATIEVKDAKGNHVKGSPFVTDANGEIRVPKLAPGTYTFKETVAPKGYILNEETATFTVKEDLTVEGKVTLTNEPVKKTKTTVLTKTDLVSGEPVPGAVIEVKDAKGNHIEGSPFTTDKDGKIYLKDLAPGTYTFKETVAPNGYILSEETATFTVKEDGTVTGQTTLKNKPEAGFILKKIDKVTKEPLMGASFTIRDEKREIFKGTTDINGELSIQGAEAGKTYTITETKAPDGYILNKEPKTVTLTEGKNVITMENQKANVEILKVDGVSLKPLAGAEFTFTLPDKTTVVKTSNAEGKIVLEGLKPGTYSYKETKAPAGYQLLEKPNTFTVDEKGNIEGVLRVENYPVEGQLTKVDSKTGKGIEGAEFAVYDKEGRYLITTKSMTDGKIYLTGLVAGEYKLKETKAPAGYSFDAQKEYAVILTEDGRIYGDTVIPNTPMEVSLKKVREDNTPLSGAEFAIYNEQGTKLMDVTSDATGKIALYGLTPGKYFYEETKAPTGYLRLKERKAFTVTERGIEGDGIIQNKEIRLEITKTDRDKKALRGATFEIRDSQGKVLGKGNTDADGKLVVRRLPAGEYSIVETKAPEGYLLDPKAQKVTVTEAGDIHPDRLTFVNEKSEIVFQKLDKETKEKLEGAEFEVRDEQGKRLKVVKSDRRGDIIIDGLAPGRYTLKEIKAPEGYLLPKQEIRFTIKDDGFLEGDNRIYNSQVSVKIMKKDLTTGATLEGAVLEIRDSHGRVLKKVTTDRLGEAEISGLDVGQYYIYEVQAPKGYILSDKPIAFRIEEDGRITGETTMYNKPEPKNPAPNIPTVPNTPKPNIPTVPTTPTVPNVPSTPTYTPPVTTAQPHTPSAPQPRGEQAKTGDEKGSKLPILFGILACAGIAGLGYYAWAKKRKTAR